MPQSRYRSIEAFWPYYVGEHSKALTRQLHFVGNTNLVVWLLVATARRSLSLLAWAVASSYAFAWVGHFFVERNRPATFEYPIWSAICDIWMYRKMLRGEMAAEVARYVP